MSRLLAMCRNKIFSPLSHFVIIATTDKRNYFLTFFFFPGLET